MRANGRRYGDGRLFSPIQVGAHLLPNRLVMAPMTRSRADANGVPTALTATYYAQRATAGLIVTEAAHVVPEGSGPSGAPGICTEAQAAGWRAVTRAVHAAGGRIFLQLWHVGRISHPSLQPNGALPVGPSAVAATGRISTALGSEPYVTPRALERDEIASLVLAFRDAAERAREAGFDGIDIHAANGYLIDQFLRDGSNRRQDAYGGSVANRARFLLEIIEAVMQVWGPGTVGVRVSPLQTHHSMADSDPLRTFAYVAETLGRLGIAYLHVVEPGPGHPRATPLGCEMLHALRREFRGCLVVDGGRDRASAEAALTALDADLVALATPFISNPDLVERLARGIPLTPADPRTFYSGGERGYIDYPFLPELTRVANGSGNQ